MKIWLLPVLFFALAACPSAQQAAPAAGRRGGPAGRGPAPDPADQATRRLLIDAAHGALSDVPDELRPYDLVEIGAREVRLAGFEEQGVADLIKAFDAAMDLRIPDTGSYAPSFATTIKTQTENQAVQGVATRHVDKALELIRRADTPHGALYDALLSAVPNGAVARVMTFTVSGPNRGNIVTTTLPTAPPQADLDVMAIVIECRQSDGSFPYQGVSRQLAGKRSDSPDRNALLRAGFSAAGEEATPARWAAAANFIGMENTLAPDMSAAAEQAARGLLRTLTNQSPMTGQQRAIGERLMAVLEADNPSETDALKAEYPQLVAVAMNPPGSLDGESASAPNGPIAGGRAGRGINLNTPANQAANQAAIQQAQATQLANTQLQADNAQDDFQRFSALVRLAQMELQRDRDGSLRDANRAQTLLPSVLVPANPTAANPAANLGRVLQQLNQGAAALDVFTRCLDAAEALDVQNDQDLDNTVDDARAKFLSQHLIPGIETTVFTSAALLDPALAERRALQYRGKMAKPLILAQLATQPGLLPTPPPPAKPAPGH